MCRPLAAQKLQHYLAFILRVATTSQVALLVKERPLGGRYSRKQMKRPSLPWRTLLRGPSQQRISDIEKLVCQVCMPNTTINNVKKLTRWLFRKKQAQSETLLPTQESLRQAIKRANYHAFVWNLETVPKSQLPPPDTLGWTLEDDKWVNILMATASCTRSYHPGGKVWPCKEPMFIK